MRKLPVIIYQLYTAAVVLTCCIVVFACTPSQRQDARTALSVVQAICVVAHQSLPETEVAQVCGVAAPLFGPMRELLAGAREVAAAQRRETLAGIAPDAGCGR